jgi:hypothetical protein
MSSHDDTNEVLEKAERFQRLFVEPMVDALRAEMKSSLAPLVEANQRQDTAIAAHQTDIDTLKGSQKKALIGWGVYASLGTVAVGSAWGWIKSKFHWG